MKILSGRVSSMTGRIALVDIVTYYHHVGYFEGTLKEFLLCFIALEEELVKKKND